MASMRNSFWERNDLRTFPFSLNNMGEIARLVQKGIDPNIQLRKVNPAKVFLPGIFCLFPYILILFIIKPYSSQKI